MNFLAHLFLSCQDENLLIGNFIADSIRNRDIPTYSSDIQKGVFLHRRIDSYTDQHPEVKKGTRRLHPNHGKYAPVVVDIFYDYILSHNWHQYSEEPLTRFSKRMYWILEQRMAELPTKLQRSVPSMISNDWLMNYGKEDGLRYVFSRMKERAKFPTNFDRAVDDLLKDYPLFEEEFNAFFPEVIREVNTFCGCD